MGACDRFGRSLAAAFQTLTPSGVRHFGAAFTFGLHCSVAAMPKHALQIASSGVRHFGAAFTCSSALKRKRCQNIALQIASSGVRHFGAAFTCSSALRGRDEEKAMPKHRTPNCIIWSAAFRCRFHLLVCAKGTRRRESDAKTSHSKLRHLECGISVPLSLARLR